MADEDKSPAPLTLQDLQLPSIATLRAIAALRSPHLSLVRPARIGLGFESAGANQKTLAEVERVLGGPGRLSLPYSLRWLLDAMTGLGVLHRSMGFVHGEVQPAHLVLGEDGVGRLIPVVHPHWARGEARDPNGLYYLPPEKLLGDQPDVRGDVFSVGVMLWEAVAGRKLMDATNVDDIISRLMSGSIPLAEAPEGEAWTEPLALIAERAISVDPGQRFPNMAVMKEAVDSACQRYLASAPGLAELFDAPERRARPALRESVAPDSERVTQPPPQVSEELLEAAAERLSRTSYAPLDSDDDVTSPNIAPSPLAHHNDPDGPAARPEQAALPQTLGPVAPAPFPMVTARGRTPAGPHGAAPATASQPAPVAVSQPAPATTPRGASLAPLVKAPPQIFQAEPDFELPVPRPGRGKLWLAVAAALVLGALALALLPRGPASPSSPPTVETAQKAALDSAANGSPEPAEPEAPVPAPATASARAIAIASTPASPDDVPQPSSAVALRAGAARAHDGSARKPTPAATPPATPEPPTPKPAKPSSQSKAVPVSEGERYGI